MTSRFPPTRRAVLLAPAALALAACAPRKSADPYANLPLSDWMDSRMDERERGIAAAFVDRVNEERRSRGLVRLSGDRALSGVSYDHAASVFLRGVFGRTLPQDRYPYERLPETVKNRYLQIGGAQLWKVEAASEWTPAYQAERGVVSWMGSTNNRRFLLEPEFNRIGAGVMEDKGDAVVVVLFGQIATLDYAT